MASSRLAMAASVLGCLALLHGCGGDGSSGNVNVPDTEAPTVSLSGPSGDYTGTVTLSAEASDDREMAGVRFQVDGSDLGDDTQAPYQQSWNTLTTNNGPHSLSAIARDAAGNTTTSAALAITVNNVVATGTIHFSVITSGTGPGLTSYTVFLDGGLRGSTDNLGNAEITEVPVGTHHIQIGQLAPFCMVLGDGLVEAVVTEGKVTSVSLSVECAPAPTGQILFQGFTFRGAGQIVRVNPDGSDPIVVLQNGRGPAWSYDRKRIVFERSEDLYAVDADGSSHLVQLTSTPEEEMFPAWSPDDTRLLYARRRDHSGPFDIFVSAASGAGAHPLFATPDTRSSAAWSPDGSRIAYVVEGIGRASLWIANADGSGAMQLTQRGIDVSPKWSPDGKSILYRHAEAEGAQTEIYSISLKSGDQTNLSQNPAFDFDPEWSPDGQWIAFISERAAAQALWIMRADGSMPLRASNPASFQFTSSPTWR